MYLCILCYCDACLKSSALRVGVKTLCNTPCQLVVSVVQEAGVQGVQAHPQKFWFGENPGKIHGNLGKTSEIFNIWAKMAPNMICFGKMVHNVCRIIWRPLFLKVISKEVLLEKCSHKKWSRSFSGKIGEIRAKIFRTHRRSQEGPKGPCLPKF